MMAPLVNWFAPDFGGHVFESSVGSWLGDHHVHADCELGGAA